MKIYKENQELVVRLPMEQDTFDAVGELVGRVQNLIGVIEGDKQGIYQSIDMTYKDKDPQIGDLLVQTYFSDDEFRKKCEELGISVFEYPVCDFCQKPILGSITLKDGKDCCFDCENKDSEHTDGAVLVK